MSDISASERKILTQELCELLKEIRGGDRNSGVRKLLEYGADPNLKFAGKTALHYAAASFGETLSAIKTLIKHGADVNVLDSREQTALNLYVKKYGRPFLLDAGNEHLRLLIGDGSSINAADGLGNTPLHNLLRIAYPSPELYLMLLRHGADPNARNKKGETPLHYLLGLECVGDALDTVLRYGADPHATDKEGNTLLHHTVTIKRGYYRPSTADDARSVATLINQGLDPSIKNKAGINALTLAIMNDRPECASTMIDAGLLPSSEDWMILAGRFKQKGKSPKLTKMLDALLEAVDENICNMAVDPEGNTLLHVLCAHGDGVKIRRLLECNAINTNARNHAGETPLMAFVQRKDINQATPLYTISALAERGAEINACTPDGYSAVMLVRRRLTDNAVDRGTKKLLTEMENSLLEQGAEGPHLQAADADVGAGATQQAATAL